MLRQSTLTARNIITTLATSRIPLRRAQALERGFSPSSWRTYASAPQRLPVYFPKRRLLPTRAAVRKRILYWTMSAMALYLCCEVYIALVIDPLLDVVLEEQDDYAKETNEDESGYFLFLPFPWGIKEIYEPAYKFTSPEWQRFIKANQDKELQKRIRRELAEHVAWSLEGYPGILAEVGGNKLHVSKWWLDAVYPNGPPPIYVIPGISIDWNEGISWSSIPLDARVADNLDHYLRPKAMFLSACTFIKTLFIRTVQDAVGSWKPSGTPTNEISWQSAAVGRMKTGGIGTPGNPDGNSSSMGTPPVGNTNPASKPSNENEGSQILLPVSAQISDALTEAWKTHAKHRVMARDTPPRGAFFLDGIMELRGTRGFVTVAVRAWYDVETKTYSNINIYLKRVTITHQKPRS
ncbi:hypothetical protein B0I35DRAFT_422787 [Stachybotrys elegans]|uniref:Uncharacterized protein n=1 Tax=Stachybotrys elegans TaxID=80388 RepID=A0A8K0WVA6_9HYPO|nr:hypothetical protein B0I35DRAFT_422787 [Stachybotrys elegans]